MRGYQRGLLAAADNGARGACPNADDRLFARGASYHRADRCPDACTHRGTDRRSDARTHRGTDERTDRDAQSDELTNASFRARAPGR